LTIAALNALISPTPAEPGGASGTYRAAFMSAPFTWSGVQLGCLARIWAAAPDTTGAAKDVPDRRM
jgi:hypothetical protein